MSNLREYSNTNLKIPVLEDNGYAVIYKMSIKVYKREIFKKFHVWNFSKSRSCQKFFHQINNPKAVALPCFLNENLREKSWRELLEMEFLPTIILV